MNHIELQEFFVEGSDQKTSHVLLHITEPNTPEEFEKGYFFALIEINNGTVRQVEQLQKVIDDIESGYYETEHEAGKDPFESTLEFINRRSAALLSTPDVHIHALVGVIKNTSLSIAAHGMPHLMLFYRQKQDFAIMNILEGHNAETKELFPSVLQGKLNTGDFLFAATPHLAEYFTADRLEKLITGKSIRQSSEHIQKVLEDMKSAHSFGGITFRMLPQSEKKLPPIPQPSQPAVAAPITHGSAASLNKLIYNKQQTAETLSPPLFRHLMRKAKIILQKKDAVPEVPQRRAQHTATPSKPAKKTIPGSEETIGNALLIGFGRALVGGGIAIVKTLRHLLMGIIRICIALFILITNKNNSRKDVLKEWRSMASRLQERFDDLPVISKLLFFLTVIACLVFAGSITTMRFRREQAKNKEMYENLVSAVQNKKDAAEASIIYDDTTKALTLLKEGRELLNQFPDSEAASAKKQALALDIDETLRKVQKMTAVPSELLADFSSINKAAQTQKLARIDDTLLAFGENDAVLYRFDLTSKQVQSNTHDGIARLRAASTPKEQDTTIFISAPSSIAAYQKNPGTLAAKDIAFPQQHNDVVDAFVYNVRLYTLERNTNQIYKHNKTQTGYDKGSQWIKTSADFSKAVSFAIDGDMYVLFADGSVKKYTRGEEQPFGISGVEPALSNPSVIWTYNEVNNIYILEPTHKRLVVLDKNGALIQQYTSNAWTSPTGMIIDEPGKTAYVLDQNKLFKISL